MKNSLLMLIACVSLTVSSCTENYSNGERIGVITKFSNSGLIWKSWEGHLNVTQTGMNSSNGFDFSIDNDNPNEEVIKTLDSAALYGWKVKLNYHEVFGYNQLSNRGATSYFVTNVEVLEKNFANPFDSRISKGELIKANESKKDTLYVIILNK